jgi:hypothetical protein
MIGHSTDNYDRHTEPKSPHGLSLVTLPILSREDLVA